MERNEAIEIVKKNWANDGFTRLREALETLIPELKESRDEKIRQWLIELFEKFVTLGVANECETSEIKVDDILYWLKKQGNLVKYYEDKLDRCACEYFNKGYKKALEKQGKQRYTDKVEPKFKVGQTIRLKESGKTFIVKAIKEFYYELSDDNVCEFKHQDYYELVEQKPADKVEPKFRVRDWVICCDYEPIQIIDIKDRMYYWSNGDIRPIEMVDSNSNIHLWTIEDAKDGDVLFQDLMGGKTFIYNGVNSDMAILYSFIISNNGEDVLPYHIGKPNTGIGNIEENKNIIYPATKEQCSLLFQKMKEAGYGLAAEKKELKKIDQKTEEKPLFSLKDFQDAFELKAKQYDIELPNRGYDIHAMCKELYSLLIKQNSAWSEEDEEMLKDIKFNFEYNKEKMTDALIAQYNRFFDKIKSLKPQPQQEWSKEDKETFSYLEDVVDFCYRNQYVVDVQTCERVRQLVSRLKSLCFQSKWSKDDITRIDEIIETLNIVQANRVRTQRMHYNKATIDKNIDWLKSLKDRYTLSRVNYK